MFIYIFFFYLAATTTTWNSSASLWGNCRHKNKFNSLTLKIVYPEGIYKCQTWQVFRVSGLTSPSICYWVLYCWFCGFWFFFPLAVKYISSFLWYVSMILLFCCVSFFFLNQNLFHLVPLPTAIANFSEHTVGKCNSYLNWKKLELKPHTVYLRDHLRRLDKICILLVSICCYSDPNSHPLAASCSILFPRQTVWFQ